MNIDNTDLLEALKKPHEKENKEIEKFDGEKVLHGAVPRNQSASVA